MLHHQISTYLGHLSSGRTDSGRPFPSESDQGRKKLSSAVRRILTRVDP
jgi:hypothetical protein